MGSGVFNASSRFKSFNTCTLSSLWSHVSHLWIQRQTSIVLLLFVLCYTIDAFQGTSHWFKTSIHSTSCIKTTHSTWADTPFVLSSSRMQILSGKLTAEQRFLFASLGSDRWLVVVWCSWRSKTDIEILSCVPSCQLLPTWRHRFLAIQKLSY